MNKFFEKVLSDTVLIRHQPAKNRKGNGLITGNTTSATELARGEVVGLGALPPALTGTPAYQTEQIPGMGTVTLGTQDAALQVGAVVAYVRTSAYELSTADEVLDVVSFFDVRVVLSLPTKPAA